MGQSAEQFVHYLETTDLLLGLPTPILTRIAHDLEPLTLAAGEALFHQGDHGDAAYFVLDGELHLDVDGTHLMRRGPGEVIGEFALIDQGVRSASAFATHKTRLLCWHRSDFHAALVDTPEVARGIVNMLTSKLREDMVSQVELLTERERFAQDLARAREIQTGMLPSALSQVNGLTIAAHCRPASGVGGDYFDYLAFDDGRVGIVIADVTGHGFYSSLFVAMAKSCLHTYTRFDNSPAGVMHALSQGLSLSIGGHLLMSCCYVLIDPVQGTLEYANAGHPALLHYHANTGEITSLPALDPILGALGNDQTFDTSGAPWCPGDSLLLYSDGLTEARSAGGEMFGLPRLHDAFAKTVNQAEPQSVVSTALKMLSDHRAGQPVDDDLTLVVIRADTTTAQR